MKKRLFSALAVTTAIATIAASSATFVSAAEKPEGAVDYSSTRYRYSIIDLNNENFTVGENINSYGDVKIDGKLAIKKFFGTGTPEATGPEDEKLYFPSVEKSKILDKETNLLRLRSRNAVMADAEGKYPYTEIYDTIKLSAGLTSSKSPLQGKENILLTSSENGIMFYVNQDGLNGEGNMVRNQYDANNVLYHIDDAFQRTINVTIHEYAYDKDGNQIINPDYDPENDEDSAQYATAAVNFGNKKVITCVWVGDQTVEYFDYVLDPAGNKIMDPVTNLPQTTTTTREIKNGDVETILSDAGSITLPRGFNGYIVAPFSSMEVNTDWMNYKDLEVTSLSLKKIISTNMYTGFYNQDKGDLYIGEYNFYGPAFATVDKAADLGEFTVPGSEGKGEVISGDPIVEPSDEPNNNNDDDEDETDDASNPNSGATGVAGAVAVCLMAAAASVVVIKKR